MLLLPLHPQIEEILNEYKSKGQAIILESDLLKNYENVKVFNERVRANFRSDALNHLQKR
jgi:hypothetical protein